MVVVTVAFGVAVPKTRSEHMKIKTKVRGGPRGCGPGGISYDVLE